MGKRPLARRASPTSLEAGGKAREPVAGKFPRRPCGEQFQGVESPARLRRGGTQPGRTLRRHRSAGRGRGLPGHPRGLKAGGPSQVWCAARLHRPIPRPPHPHLVTSPPSRRASEVRGAGAERGGECGRRAGAWGLAPGGQGVRRAGGRRAGPGERPRARGPQRRRPPAGPRGRSARTRALRLPPPPRSCAWAGPGVLVSVRRSGPAACGRSLPEERAGRPRDRRLFKRNPASVLRRDGGPSPILEAVPPPAEDARPPAAVFFMALLGSGFRSPRWSPGPAGPGAWRGRGGG